MSSTSFGSLIPPLAAVTKEQSNWTLCPTRTHPSTNSSKRGITSEMDGASATMRSVMPVRRTTKGSMAFPG